MYTESFVKEIPLLADRPLAKLIAYVAGVSSEMPFNDKRKAVLIIPGGAYWLQSDAEADPIAHYYMAMGYNAFVLRYSVGRGVDSVWPKPLLEASAAMKFIRDHAEKFHIDPDYVFVIGFSAGGHLAAAVATSTTVLDCQPEGIQEVQYYQACQTCGSHQGIPVSTQETTNHVVTFSADECHYVH